jgi:hypothetical protein
MKKWSIFIISIVLYHWTGNALYGANIEFSRTSHGDHQVYNFRVDGLIYANDYQDFTRIYDSLEIDHNSYPTIEVELSGPGGSFSGGLRLAAEFRRRGIGTVVRAGDVCLSACALAFLGGSAESPNPYEISKDIPILPARRRMEPGAKIGFHAPDLPILSQSEYSSDVVRDVFRLGIDGIVLLMDISEKFGLRKWQLVQMLSHKGEDYLFVDSAYTARSFLIDPLISKDFEFKGFTKSMALNSCINRWYDSQGQNILKGYDEALQAKSNFEEFYFLLNGAEWDFRNYVDNIDLQGYSTWRVYFPVAQSKRGFIWCSFSINPRWQDETIILYYDSLFGAPNEFNEEKNDDPFAKKIEYENVDIALQGTFDRYMVQMFESVEPKTLISDIETRINNYYATEMILDPGLRP